MDLHRCSPKLIEWYQARGLSPLTSKPTRKINAGNTVVVKDDNTHYLGFIQDIEDNRVFVDFDCSGKSASWFSEQDVWPYDVDGGAVAVGYPLKAIYPVTAILAATRLDKNAPLIFGPATLLMDSSKRNGYFTAVTSSNKILHRCQIVTHDELTPENSLHGRRNRQHAGKYVKHVIRFRSAYSVTHIDPCRIHYEMKQSMHMFASRSLHPAGHSGFEQVRFHADFGDHYVTILLWERSAQQQVINLTPEFLAQHPQITIAEVRFPNPSVFWTDVHLAQALARSVDCGAIVYQTPSPALFPERPVAVFGGQETERGVPGLEYLLPELLCEILEFLNAREQSIVKRILFQRWNNAIPSNYNTTHAIIDFHTVYPRLGSSNQSYQLSAMLDQVYHPYLKTVTICNWALDRYTVEAFLCYIQVRKMDLLAIQLCDGVVIDEISIELGKWSKLHHLQDIAERCKHSLLVNYTLIDAVSRNQTVLSRMRFHCQPTPVLSPIVTIPKFCFHRDKPELEQFNMFLAAVVDNCSEVSPEDQQRIVGVFNTWVAEIQTPLQALALQEFLVRNSEHPVAGTLEAWTLDDAKGTDPASFNKLILHAISNYPGSIMRRMQAGFLGL